MAPEDGVEVMGHVVRSCVMRAWAQSRAVEARRAGEGEEGRGEGSWQRRLPRSKVKGIGFVTVTELRGGGVSGVGVGRDWKMDLRFFWFRGAGGGGEVRGRGCL